MARQLPFSERAHCGIEVQSYTGQMNAPPREIRIAAALIHDGSGKMLLVRKRGTPWFMQAGGKPERGEDAISALRRELAEEIGLEIIAEDATAIGVFREVAANEENAIVEAEIFEVKFSGHVECSFEIEEAVWVDSAQAAQLPLAPLTRNRVLPIFSTL